MNMHCPMVGGAVFKEKVGGNYVTPEFLQCVFIFAVEVEVLGSWSAFLHNTGTVNADVL
jgi:hypothetical protein